MIPPAARRFLERARVAHLATADAGGRPHVVPIVFAVDDAALYSAIDEKPKRAPATRLRRVRNILANPRAAVVADRYDEDWQRLGYVLVEGAASVVESGPVHQRAVALLRAKYPQYAGQRLEERPLIVLEAERVITWGWLG